MPGGRETRSPQSSRLIALPRLIPRECCFQVIYLRTKFFFPQAIRVLPAGEQAPRNGLRGWKCGLGRSG